MTRLNIAMLSNEDQEQNQVVAQNAEDHLEVLGQQVEDDLLQAQQVQIESDQEDAAVEDAVQATEDLLDEQQAAEDLVERKEQVTQAAMESIQRNVKNILKNIGMEAGAVDLYRPKSEQTKQEDKTEPQNKEEAAKAASSSIGEFIKKIWEKIKEVWFRIVDAIKDFFKKLFNASVGLKKRAAAVKQEAEKLEGKSIPSDAKFEAPESVKENIRMDHKAIPAGTFDKGLTRQNEEMKKFIGNVTNERAMGRYELAIGDLAKKMASEAFDGHSATIEKMLNGDPEEERLINLALEPVLVYFTQKNGTELGTPAFISDRVITLNERTLKVGVTGIEGRDTAKPNHDPLELFQIKKVCDIVIKQMGEYEGLEKKADEFKKFSKKVEEVQAQLINQNKDTPFIKRRTMSAIAADCVRFYMNIIKTISTQGRMIDMQVNKAAIDWCAASLKLYK